LKRFTRRLTSAIVAAMLLFGVIPAAAYGAGQPSEKTYRIVGLGDSITLGYEPGMDFNSVPYGYVERLYEQALFRGRATMENYGIIGLRVEGLNRLLLGAANGETLSAQDLQDFSMFPRTEEIVTLAQSVAERTGELRASLAEADLVTITIGGNDFSHFLRKLLTLSMDNITKSLDNEYAPLVEQYVVETKAAIRQVAALAPDAKIVISDQYLPVPRLMRPELYDTLYEQVVAPLTAAVDEMAADLQAEGINVTAVSVANRFKGKEGAMTYMSISLTGDAEPDIHPRQAGYQAIAEAFAEAIWQEYRSPAPRGADVPISVVVNGRELITDYKPTLVNNRTFLALRDVADAMGAELQWDEPTKTAVFRQNGREVAITIGSDTMLVDGKPQKLDAPAYLRTVVINGKTEAKTYVPLAVIATGLQYDVQYRKTLQTAFINR